jgi:hypothetical protein
MRRLVGALVAVAIAVAGASCTDDKVKANQASVNVDSGSRVLVAERGDRLRLATGQVTLHLGARVEVLEGSASISLHDGSSLEVRDGSKIELGTPLVLKAQDLLVTSGNAPLEVSAADSRFKVEGVAKLSRDLAAAARSYRGNVQVTSAGRSVTVPALRQVEVASLGALPDTPEALGYDAADSWDRRFLGAAIELGEELEAKSEGFARSLRPGEGRTPGFYRLLLPPLEDEEAFGEEMLADESFDPGDLLVGATIVVSGRLGTFAERWASVFAFKDQGAKWGLVALDQQVNDLQAIVATVDTAIGKQQFQFTEPVQVAAPVAPAAAPAAPVETPAAPAPASPPAPRPSNPAPASTAPRTPTAEPLLSVPQLVQPDPLPPTEGLLTPLLTVVTTTLDGLLGGSSTSTAPPQ